MAMTPRGVQTPPYQVLLYRALLLFPLAMAAMAADTARAQMPPAIAAPTPSRS